MIRYWTFAGPVFLLLLHFVVHTNASEKAVAYCKCWEDHYTPGDPNALETCMNKVFNPMEREAYTDEERKRCWEQHPQYSRFQDETKSCTLLRIKELLPLFLEGYKKLPKVKPEETEDMLELMREVTSSEEYDCKSIKKYFRHSYHIHTTNYLLLSLGIEARHSYNKDHEIQTPVVTTDESTCKEALKPFENRFRMYSYFESMIKYTFRNCKGDYSETRYYCYDYPAIQDISDFYRNGWYSPEEEKYLCDFIGARVTLSGCRVSKWTGGAGDYPRDRLSKPLMGVLKPMQELMLRGGYKSKTLQSLMKILPIESHDGYFNTITYICGNFDSITAPKCLNSSPKKDEICFMPAIIEDINDLYKKQTLKIVDTTINYVPYLTVEALKQVVEEKFDQLSKYFQKTREYNTLKSAHDLEYIKRRLNRYETSLQSVSQSLGEDMTLILESAFVQATIDLGNEIVRFTADMIALFNPFGWMSGAAKPSDLEGKVRKLLKAGQRVKDASDLIDGYIRLVGEAETIAENVQKNKEDLKKMYDLITIDDGWATMTFEEDGTLFLAEYGKYNPAVDPTILDEAKANWNAVINKGCALMESIPESAYTIANKLFLVGKCVRTRGKIAQLWGLFDEIYKFQNEFREATAIYLRERLAVDNSKRLKLNIDNRNSLVANKVLTIDAIDAISTINYEIQSAKIVQSYCNVLQYKKGGKLPQACEREKFNIQEILGIKIGKLLPSQKVIDIPVLGWSDDLKTAINITELSMGKEVTFQIPSYDWLVKHSTFFEHKSNIPTYVKRFALYLPVEGDNSNILSEGEVTGSYPLVDPTVSYASTQSFKSSYEYVVGKQQNVCTDSETKPNPYNYCKDPLPKYCPLVKDTDSCDDSVRMAPYPSISASWKFKISIRGRGTVVIPKTKVSIKGLLVVCRPSHLVAKNRQNKEVRSSISGRTCCTGKYWNTATESCANCPKDSSSKMNGYYCQRND